MPSPMKLDTLEELAIGGIMENVKVYMEEVRGEKPENVALLHPFFTPPPYDGRHFSKAVDVPAGSKVMIDGSQVPLDEEMDWTPPRHNLPYPLPGNIADTLFQRITEAGLLCDSTLKLFDSDCAPLSRVEIHGVQQEHGKGPEWPIESDASLTILNSHPLQFLVLRNLRNSKKGLQIDVEHLVNDVISKVSKEEKLSLLDLSYSLHPKFPKINNNGSKRLFNRLGGRRDDGDIDTGFSPFIKYLTQIVNLRVLMVAGSCVDNRSLCILIRGLPHLTYLDISETNVSDVSVFEEAKERLEAIFLHGTEVNNAAGVLSTLDKLRSLDISRNPVTSASGQSSSNWNRLAQDIMEKILARRKEGQGPWPHLQILDISGSQANFQAESVSNFLRSIPKLEFLGLMFTSLSTWDEVTTFRNIKIAGEGSKEQLMCALETYGRADREAYLSRALHQIFTELHQAYDNFTLEEIFQLFRNILKAMRVLRTSLSIQMATTACLYNLCRQDRARMFGVDDLGDALNSCLDALETFPGTLQLHKNAWLTVCNDYILQSKNYDMYRCCHVALESMTHHADAAVTKMTVAIVSILAAKIPIEKTTMLGTNERYMKFMLEVVKAKLEEHHQQVQNLPVNGQPPLPDISLKFTLSALWNLTDESPKTCEKFLTNAGLGMVLDVLETYQIPGIQTKVLGLLNNVAEVSSLKSKLIDSRLLVAVKNLLSSDKIEVSYFAAGILAHLLHGEPWSLLPTSDEITDALIATVTGWGKLDTEMVAYRSFRPFFPLLARDDLPAVQFWSVWAIRHVCSNNRERYVELILTEGGREAIKGLLDRWTEDGKNGRETALSIRECSMDLMELFDAQCPTCHQPLYECRGSCN